MRRVIVLLALFSVIAAAEPASAHVNARLSQVVAGNEAQPSPAIALPDTVAPLAGPEAAEPAPERRPPPPGMGAVALAGSLLLALAAGGALGSARLRRTAAIATSALVLVFIAESGPHLVHHALDPGQAEQCQVLKAAGHSEATTLAVDPPPVPGTLESIQAAALVHPPDTSRPAACGRAPPAA